MSFFFSFLLIFGLYFLALLVELPWGKVLRGSGACLLDGFEGSIWGFEFYYLLGDYFRGLYFLEGLLLFLKGAGFFEPDFPKTDDVI